MKRKTKKVNKKKKVNRRKTKKISKKHSFLIKGAEKLDEELTKIAKKSKKVLKNPSTGPLAMPGNVQDAFAWGYIKGVEKGLSVSGLTDFFERRNLKKKIDEIKARWEETVDIELESQLIGSTRSRMPSVRER